MGIWSLSNLADGVLLAPGTKVSELDPKTIESVEVIKGAAAESLYGSRAVNGVIRITTRRIPD
jgi:Ca-activated chloride channel family protein